MLIHPKEGILPGMTFEEHKYVLTLHPFGNIKILSVHGTYAIGEYRRKRTYAQVMSTKPNMRRKFWLLDNGCLVRMKLDPIDGYACSEPGFYDPCPGGPVKIVGRYPNYVSSSGERVWIMVDGRFTNQEPKPGVENSFHVQLMKKHDKMLTMSKKRVSVRSEEDEFRPFFQCEHCGERSERRSNRRKFCSDYCRLRSHLRKHGL